MQAKLIWKDLLYLLHHSLVPWRRRGSRDTAIQHNSERLRGGLDQEHQRQGKEQAQRKGKPWLLCCCADGDNNAWVDRKLLTPTREWCVGGKQAPDNRVTNSDVDHISAWQSRDRHVTKSRPQNAFLWHWPQEKNPRQTIKNKKIMLSSRLIIPALR